MKQLPVSIFLILLCTAALACADQGLQRFEPPTPTSTPEPALLHMIWAKQVCAFAPNFEDVATAWEKALDATPSPNLEALREELLRLVSFDFRETTSSTFQWLGLLHSATTSDSEWFGRPASTAPPGVAEYEQTLFDLFLDFEPVLNYAESEIRQAGSLDELEAIHASVKSAQERMVASAREAVGSLSPEALAALRVVDECAFIRG